MFGVISAEYTDKGAAGGVPALTTTGQIQMRQKRQEVEHVVNAVRHQTPRPTPTAAPARTAAASATDDWIQLNGPFNLHQIDSVTVRYADNAAGRTGRARRWRRSRSGTGSQTGPIVTTLNLTSTGSDHARWNSQTFPISLDGQERAVPRVPRGDRRRDRRQLFLLNWGSSTATA